MPEFYTYLRTGYATCKNYRTEILSMFSREQLFSIMKLNKAIALLKDSRLNSVQHISVWNARLNIDMLGQKKSVTFPLLK